MSRPKAQPPRPPTSTYTATRTAQLVARFIEDACPFDDLSLIVELLKLTRIPPSNATHDDLSATLTGEHVDLDVADDLAPAVAEQVRAAILDAERIGRLYGFAMGRELMRRELRQRAAAAGTERQS
jgi:hypothetical protein